MATITIRNLPNETHRTLKQRATKNGRSMAAEVRAILEEAVFPVSRTLIGSELAAFGRRFGGIDLDIARDQTPALEGAADFMRSETPAPSEG